MEHRRGAGAVRGKEAKGGHGADARKVARGAGAGNQANKSRETAEERVAKELMARPGCKRRARRLGYFIRARLSAWAWSWRSRTSNASSIAA